MTRKWLVAKKVPAAFQAQFPEIDPIILQLLFNRNIRDQKAIDEFLNPDYGQDIHDPFLFVDMKKAVKRIFEAVQKKEKITVHGDYDADGVCASVMLVETLKKLGANSVEVYLPHREREGYGLNMNSVTTIAKGGTKLIITCDCGTSNAPEIALANEKGMDVIVTDHHEEPTTKPAAYAILNPQFKRETYPFKYLAAGGVAYKLVQALCVEDKGKRLLDGYEKWLLDLVAISTVADMMRLVGENRTLVKYGLVVLRKTRRVGLQKLIDLAGIRPERIDTYSIGFQIAPRLNAAGRMDHANTAFELLETQDELAAEQISQELNKKNQERQTMTEKVVEQAKKQIGELPPDIRMVTAFQKDWPAGLLGLIAGKLANHYYRPAFAMTLKDKTIVASGRSIPAFDITQALVHHEKLFEKYGGHSQACGFSMAKSNLSVFQESLEQYAHKQLGKEDLVPRMMIDAQVKLADIHWDIWETLEKLEPFGEKNPRPTLLTEGLTVTSIDRVGNDGKHLRLLVEQGTGQPHKLIAFGFANSWGDKLNVGDKVDIVFEVSVNEWNSERQLQLKVKDLKHASNE